MPPIFHYKLLTSKILRKTYNKLRCNGSHLNLWNVDLDQILLTVVMYKYIILHLIYTLYYTCISWLVITLENLLPVKISSVNLILNSICFYILSERYSERELWTQKPHLSIWAILETCSDWSTAAGSTKHCCSSWWGCISRWSYWS